MHRIWALAHLTIAVATAGIIYDNGSPNQFDGSELTSFLQAEDFTLSGTSTFDTIRFWTLEDAASYSGSIFWAIYADNGGEPGSILFSSEGVPSRANTLMSALLLDEFVYTLAVPSITL